jgi:predicted NACHT family NTPase
MASYIASPEGIAKANSAKERLWNKSIRRVADAAQHSRTTVNNFFNGKPVECKVFKNICKALELEWTEIYTIEKQGVETEANPEINILVQTIRERVSADILERCGIMKILDMEQPIESSDIYTDVNILERISGRSRLEYAEMLAICQDEDFERLMLGKVKEERVPGRLRL